MKDEPQAGTPQRSREFRIPEGTDFLETLRHQEEACEESFDNWLPTAGQKAPQTLDTLGTALSLLDRIASCWWGCEGGDHQRERLLGRADSNSRAIVLLLRMGYYDEALGIVRQLGELVNLLWLFMLSDEALLEWQGADEEERRRRFKPVDVRIRIEDLDAPQPMDQHLYGKLSGMSTHTEPDTNPQSHNAFGIPSLGAYFQETGALVVLNHLAQLVVVALVFGATLLKNEPDRSLVFDAARHLAESIGGVDLDTAQEYWAQIQKTPEFRSLQAELWKEQQDRRIAFATHDKLSQRDDGQAEGPE